MNYRSLEEHLDGLRRRYTATVEGIIKDATKESEDSTYEVNRDNLTDEYDLPYDCDLISEMLAERSEIIEAVAHGYGIEMALDPQFCERMIADPESIPESHLQSRYATYLIAAYENLLPVQEQNRVTYYWGNYGGYAQKDVPDEKLRSVYAEALQAVNMSSEAYQDKKIGFQDEVETHMRSCMLAKILYPDDEIVYIPPSPTGENGQWQYEAGRVVEAYADIKNCVVSFEDGVATIPYRYVLALFRDENYDGNAFGFDKAEPVFGLTENMAEHFLCEAKQEHEQQHMDDIQSPNDDEDQGMTLQ